MANAINKTTLIQMFSINTPEYSLEDWIINPVLPECDKKYWKIVNNEVLEMIEEEKDALNSTLLLKEIATKIAQVDKNTTSLIAKGFVYGSNTFSLSIEAQTNWQVIKNNTDLLTFPLAISTKDNKEYLLIADNVTSFFMTAVGTIKAYMDNGRALKIQMQVVTTKEELDSIVDTR